VENASSHVDSLSAFTTRPASAKAPQVLLCLDRSELTETILAYAVMLTRAVGGSLTLFHVVESSADRNSRTHDVLLWELKHRQAREYMDQMLERVTRLEVRASLKIEEGGAAEQILGFIRKNPVDFVILASHGIHGVAEWSLSSTAAKVIGRTHSSFVMVPTTPIHQHRELEPCIQRILVPLDGSLSSQTALPSAIRIARQQDAELILVHAIESTSFHNYSGIKGEDRKVIDAASSILASVARDYFELIADRLRKEGLEVSVVVRQNSNPVALISEVIASRNVDFMVMSAHGASGSDQYPLARTPAHMATHTSVPLLIIQDLEKEHISRALERRRSETAPLRCSRPTEDRPG
jgi:nucleotide-binding universal stress UspA family protein